MTPSASQILAKSILHARIFQKMAVAIVQAQPLIWTKTVTMRKTLASPVPVQEIPLVWVSQERGGFCADVLLGTVGPPVTRPLLPVAPTPVNTEAFAIRTLCTLCASALLDMPEDSVSWSTMSVRPAPATTVLCARMESMATPASVSQAIKAGTATWKWTSVCQTPARTRPRASTR